MFRTIGMLWIVMFFCLGVQAQKVDLKPFIYSGMNWGSFEGHKVSLVVLDTSVGGSAVIAEELIKDGLFKVSGKIACPQNAYFGLYNPAGDYVYKQEFVAEPGAMEINYNSFDKSIQIVGGKYNELFAQLRNNAAYKAKKESFEAFSKSLKSNDLRDENTQEKYYKFRNELSQILSLQYDSIRFYHYDPLARLLAITHSNRSVGYEAELDDLQKMLGEVPEISYLKYRLAEAKKKEQNKVSIQIGSVIKNFSGTDIKGDTTHLKDVLKANKYTLVEFWASWCAPCRAEIPHMKKAYEVYKSKGFEILSFTLDHEFARWQKATEEENLPWINIGDLKAYKSPVVIHFGIRGIPANYLVDASGKVVAINLRQEKLDEKLGELLK